MPERNFTFRKVDDDDREAEEAMHEYMRTVEGREATFSELNVRYDLFDPMEPAGKTHKKLAIYIETALANLRQQPSGQKNTPDHFYRFQPCLFDLVVSTQRPLKRVLPHVLDGNTGGHAFHRILAPLGLPRTLSFLPFDDQGPFMGRGDAIDAHTEDDWFRPDLLYGKGGGHQSS